MTATTLDNHLSELRSDGRSRSFWHFVGPLFFALAFLGALTRGFETQDETWFLQVVHRVTSGEVLYRDVFYGATPLAVYITLPFTYLFGSEMLVSKAVHASCFLFTLWLCCRIARQLGLRQFSLLVILPVFLYVSPHADTVGSLYTPLANLFYLGCFSACLMWFDDPSKPSMRAGTSSGVKDPLPPEPTDILQFTRDHDPSLRVFESTADRGWMRLLWLSAIAAGLTLATKHNYGLYATAALVFAVALRPSGYGDTLSRRMRTMSAVLALVLLVAMTVLLPVWWSGGLPAFLEFGLTNKQNYLRHARIGYFDGLMMVARSPVALIPYLLPGLTGGLLGLAWLRADSRAKPRIAVVAGFVAMNCLGVFPRADLAHVRHVVPMCVLGWLCAWQAIRISQSGAAAVLLRRAATLCFVVLFGMNVLAITFTLTSQEHEFSAFKHFRGILVRNELHSRMEAWRAGLNERIASDQAVFFVSTDAAFWYLLTEKQNPTRFDYPLVTAFGRHGEVEVATAFAQGELDVLLDLRAYERIPNLRPELLIRLVEQAGEPISNLGFSTLYRRTAPAIRDPSIERRNSAEVTELKKFEFLPDGD